MSLSFLSQYERWFGLYIFLVLVFFVSKNIFLSVHFLVILWIQLFWPKSQPIDHCLMCVLNYMCCGVMTGRDLSLLPPEFHRH